jgi:hypothetical protein
MNIKDSLHLQPSKPHFLEKMYGKAGIKWRTKWVSRI